MKLSVGNSPEFIQKAQDVRKQVFVIEQNIPQNLDLDGLDEESHHSLVFVGESVAGTARLTINSDIHAVLARVAVRKEFRGSGIARKLVESLLSLADELKINTIEIHAHEYLRNYYAELGFEYIKDVEVVGGHQLIEMHRSQQYI